MKYLLFFLFCLHVLSSCSDNNPADPPIIGKWVIYRYEPGQNNNSPNQCDYARIHYIQNTGQIQYINTSNNINCGTVGIQLVGTWTLRNDSIICVDDRGAIIAPFGKIVTLTNTELTTSFFGDKLFYKKQN